MVECCADASLPHALLIECVLHRFIDVWAAFIAMEVAEQELGAARGIYKRCYSNVLEDGGQVRPCFSLPRIPPTSLQEDIWSP